METQKMTAGRFGKKFFNIENSTLVFFLLNVATLNIFYCFWVYNMCNYINKYYNEEKIVKPLAICMIAFMAWGDVFASFEPYEFASNPSLLIFLPLILVGPILAIIISFKSRPYIQKMLSDNGVPSHLSGFLCFIFAGYYQYYCIRNAEERYSKNLSIVATPQNSQPGKIERIEKLARLKESGAISEEEFLSEKQKILSGVND